MMFGLLINFLCWIVIALLRTIDFWVIIKKNNSSIFHFHWITCMQQEINFTVYRRVIKKNDGVFSSFYVRFSFKYFYKHWFKINLRTYIKLHISFFNRAMDLIKFTVSNSYIKFWQRNWCDLFSETILWMGIDTEKKKWKVRHDNGVPHLYLKPTWQCNFPRKQNHQSHFIFPCLSPYVWILNSSITRHLCYLFE